MSKRTLILTIIVFIIALTARCYWFNQKQGYHTDEIFTVIVSKNNEYGFTQYFDTEKEYNGKELKEIVFGFSDNSPKEILKDLKSLRYHNNGDTPNTPLYYSLFRTFQLGNNSNDINIIFQRGFYLNLILFTLSFFFMFRLLNLLNIEKMYIPLILGFCYLNTGTISISIFSRYYALQETAFVFMCYTFAYIYKTEKINTFKNYLKISLSGALTLLSGYYGIIYSALLGLILLIKKSPKWFLLISFLTSTGITLLVYPNYTDFIYAPRAGILDNSLISNITTNISLLFFSGYQILLNYLFYALILVILFVVLVRNKKLLKNNVLWYLISINFVCYIVFLLFAPQKVLRYTEPLLPVLSLVIPAIIIECKKYKSLFLSLIFLIFTINIIFPTKYESYDSMLNPPRMNIMRGNIENLFVNTNCKPITQSDNPILVTETNGWNILNIIPYLKDEQKIKIEYTEEPQIYNGKSLLLVTEKTLILPSKINIEKEFLCQRFKGYIIEN